MSSEFRAERSRTADISLDVLIDRLASSALVEGIIVFGTTGTSLMTTTSDYDLLLVFNRDDVPLRMVTTWIDQRLAEVYCTSLASLERIAAAPEPWLDTSEEGAILRWLRDGRIAHDPYGALARLRARAVAAPTPALPEGDAIYEAWRKIGYNVAHLLRYHAANDPVSRLAVEMRLLYSIAEVQGHYFTVRRLPWRGEKSAIRYWTAHDPAFADALQHYFAETDCHERVARYVELARHALAPVGGLWESGSTVVSVGAPFGSSMQSAPSATPDVGLATWRRLIGADA